jgi:hypothetical protein
LLRFPQLTIRLYKTSFCWHKKSGGYISNCNPTMNAANQVLTSQQLLLCCCCCCKKTTNCDLSKSSNLLPFFFKTFLLFGRQLNLIIQILTNFTVVGYQRIPHSLQVYKVCRCSKSQNYVTATFFPPFVQKNAHVSGSW